MKTIKYGVDRRTVIEAYARYDCDKNSRAIPDFSAWDWSEADSIDCEMRRARLKVGIPAGYRLWDHIEVFISDLRECAVSGSIFPGEQRALGLLECVDKFKDWKPNRITTWFDKINAGEALFEAAPMLIRPAVRGEWPARWYVEDGSGRAITFVKNQHLFEATQAVAIGYLGRRPDPESLFMQAKFPELLASV